MKQLTLNQAMSYGQFGIRTMGYHTIFKLRYTPEQAKRFINSDLAKKWSNDIYLFTTNVNKKGKQYTWVIAVVQAGGQASADLFKLSLIVKADKLIDKAEELYAIAGQCNHDELYNTSYESIIDAL
jgi:hypothetical protein